MLPSVAGRRWRSLHLLRGGFEGIRTASVLFSGIRSRRGSARGIEEDALCCEGALLALGRAGGGSLHLLLRNGSFGNLSRRPLGRHPLSGAIVLPRAV